MTDTRRKAQIMLNDARDAHVNPDDYLVGYTALCRAIEQHEAFRQGVSDAAQEATEIIDHWIGDRAGAKCLQDFIIPKPKPDPLIEVLRSVGGDDRDYCDYDIYVKEIRAALDAAGFEIREKNDG